MVVEYLITDYFNVNVLSDYNEFFMLSISFIVYIFLVFLTLYINLYPIKKIEKSTIKLSNGNDSEKTDQRQQDPLYNVS